MLQQAASSQTAIPPSHLSWPLVRAFQAHQLQVAEEGDRRRLKKFIVRAWKAFTRKCMEERASYTWVSESLPDLLADQSCETHMEYLRLQRLVHHNSSGEQKDYTRHSILLQHLIQEEIERHLLC